jgi:hypothetical protein
MKSHKTTGINIFTIYFWLNDRRIGSGRPKTYGSAILHFIGNISIHNLLLKVHKIENFFGSEFEFYTISLLVMLKY